MKIATLLNCHDKPNLVLDTIESIKTWVSTDVGVMIDASGWEKFSKVKWKTKVFKALHHNFYKSPYRNITFGLKKIYELFPCYDWYVYTEYDCIFTSDAFLSDLKDKNGICCLASDVRISNGSIPKLNEILSGEVVKFKNVLGCCVFYSGEFIKKLYDINFCDKLLDATKNFSTGSFPAFHGYAFEETLYPTLVEYFGGTVYDLGKWNNNEWTNSKYNMRFRPDINQNELTPNVSIIHPLKKIDCSVRNCYEKFRKDYLKWHDRKLDLDEIDYSYEKLSYIVCGTGRCGTVYMSALLNSIGISCGHERIFTNNGCSFKNYGYNSESSSWAKTKQVEDPFLPLSAESSYMAAPYLQDDFLNEAKVIHVVREPLNVINSFINGLGYFKYKNTPENIYEKWILSHVPEIKEVENPILRASLYYVKWNLMIEHNSKDKCYFRYCVENDEKDLIKFLGLSPKNYYNNKKCNSVIASNSLSWNDIPDSSIKKDLKNIFERYYK